MKNICEWENCKNNGEFKAPVERDKLIYEEKDEGFTCGIGVSSDEKYYIIATSDHTTSETYFFSVNENNPKLK